MTEQQQNDTPAQPQNGPEASAEAVVETRVEAATAPESARAPESGRVAELEAEVGKLKDQLLRALAEQENVRRRAEREREDTAKYAISKFAKDLLAVADNLRRAIDAVPEETRAANEAVNALLTGVDATERQLQASFERAGITRMDALDKPADPNFHQIMMEIEGTGKQAGTVVQVLQAGYTIQGRLLREAIVGVAKGDAGAKVDTTA